MISCFYKIANPFFKALYPNSLEDSRKKYFFSKSLAIIGSIINEDLPVPEGPMINVDSNLLLSNILTGLPVPLSLHKSISKL